VVGAARPVLEQGADSLGDTFFLVAARNGRLTVLDKAEGSGELRASPRLGSTIPVHATAVGKLYLAYAAGEIADALVARERFTPHTLVEPQALAADVRAAAERGYACNRKEWIEGLSVVAAPILVRGQLLGAICTALPSTRFERLAEADLATRVIAAAREVSRRLSGEPITEQPQGATR
jgi:DNA-binding IclR family transcriptional regulator